MSFNGKFGIYESLNLNGNINAQRVSPRQIRSFSLLLKTTIELWPWRNQENTIKKLSIENFEFRNNSEMNKGYW